MHALETIKHLNERACQKCVDCGTGRGVLEGRGSFLASYELAGKHVLLCRDCRGTRTEDAHQQEQNAAAYRQARRENETEV